MDLSKGDFVKVKANGNRVLSLYVVRVKKNSIILTNEEEYKNTLNKGQEPELQVGFPARDVIEVVQKSAM